MNEFEEPLKVAPQQRPTITIPSNSSSSSFADSSLLCGASPGAMIYVPNFLGDNSAEQGDYPSFSDLLSGAIATPEGVLGYRKRESGDGDGDGGSGFKRNKPENLVLPMNISSAFAVSPGFSPSAFLNSPTFFSSSLNPYSLSCQQALAQVPPAAMLSRPHLGVQTEFYSPASALNPLSPSMAFQSSTFITPSSQPTCSNARQPNIRPQNLPAAVDKPANDGYNWRKYGQKQVKGSEYPRSYYKCTTPNCPVKKKVERSFVGHITEIIYKGQHNHAPPQNGRRGRDGTGSLADLGSEDQVGNFQLSGRLGRDSDSTQATSIQLQGPSDSEESGENYQQMEDDEDYYDEDDEPNVNKRNAGSGTCDIHFTHKTMTEPKIVVQTRSEVDLLDDGYRWRKYGQKVVKGNPNPRSYYKCTTVGCKVRKHVERASTDPQAVITTYEGKHNHDLPAARGNAMINSSNMDQQQTMLHNSVAQMNFGSKDQMSISLRLKEEQIVV